MLLYEPTSSLAAAVACGLPASRVADLACRSPDPCHAGRLRREPLAYPLEDHVAAAQSRRALLGAAAAALPLLLAGCKGVQALGAPPRPAPDVALLQAAISAEELMVARYQAALRLPQPLPAATLGALLAEHQAHLGQLRSRLIPGSPQAAGAVASAGAVRSAGARPSAGRPSPSPGQPSVPAGARPAASYLADAEQAASDYLLRQLLLAPPALAQLLASISASEATHVPVLQAVGG